ncbi:MAG: 2-oxo acid dehydrogenase subunit E2 [Desulfobacteraceae bacterium]|nr:2-oxo acid dehydrogenase subunit E2 [Desulfobacteraceae bacterium]
MIEIAIPKLGLTMESATLAGWHCKSGDKVKKDDILLIIETDKVSFEVLSPGDGIIHPVAKEGETYNTGDVVGYLAEDRHEYERIIIDHPHAEAGVAEKAEALQAGAVLEKGRDSLPPSSSSKKGRIKASPLARKMAATHNLDLTKITGSGPGGTIVKADILRIMEKGETIPEEKVKEVREERPEAVMVKEVLESIPIKGIRRAIFDNMYQSLTQSAQLTLHTEARAEAILDLRERLTINGQKVSFNAILMKITAMALRLHPKINASVDGNKIHVWRQIHIGLAMEADNGLIVPVIRNPDLKAIREIDREITELVHKTRENLLSPDDFANGTFTISNLGFADIDHFTPIIRPPESAILGVGRITRKPVVIDNDVIPGVRIGLSLTFDHRIIYGTPAARFLKTIKETVEDPILMIS